MKPTIAPYFPPPPILIHSKKTIRPNSPANNAPQSLRRSRKYLLPALLLLTFTITILSTIYAYCIASPHTRLTSTDYSNNPNAELSDSIFRRRNDTASSPGLTAPLAFYALTTPLATITLILLELTQHILRPKLNYRSNTHYTYVFLSLLLCSGWLTSSLLWTHCEISPLPHQSQTLCPPSVRGHFMFGIHELSIAKTVLGLLVGLGFGLHAVLVVKNLRGLKRILGANRREGLGLKHGDAQMMLEREMSEGLRVQRGLQREMRREGKGRVRIVG